MSLKKLLSGTQVLRLKKTGNIKVTTTHVIFATTAFFFFPFFFPVEHFEICHTITI